MEKLEGEGGDSRLCYSACLTHSRFNLSTTKEKSLGDLGLYFPFLTPGRAKAGLFKTLRIQRSGLLLLQTLLWAQKGSICSMFNTKWQQPLCSRNKISHRVSREMYTGRETGVEPGNPGRPQGLCLLPSQLQKIP